jgi:hypothetical protein
VNNHWNIDDMSAYDMKSPYDREYERFDMQKTETPQINSLVTGSLPDLLLSSRQPLEVVWDQLAWILHLEIAPDLKRQQRA